MFQAGHTTTSSIPIAADGNAATRLQPDEAAMVAALKAGSEDAYLWLFARYHKHIYNCLYRALHDVTEAPDVTQEVFLKVFRGISSFNGESSLKTWMQRIAMNEASNRRRWFRRHRAMETSIEPSGDDRDRASIALRDRLHDSGESPFERVARHQMRVRMEQALRTLPEHYRTTVVLREIDDLSYEEIAERTCAGVGTVKSRLVRGRQALRAQLRSDAARRPHCC